MKPSIKRTAESITAVYVIVGGIWILLSDLAVESLLQNPALVTRFQTYKGFAFILFTAAILYMVLRRRLAAVEDAQRHLEQFRYIVEHAGQEIYWVKKTGEIAYVNRAAANSLGYTAAEMVRSNISDFDLVYGPYFAEHFEKVKKEKIAAPFETRHIAKDGRIIPKEMRSVYLSMGKEELICGFGSDISQRKEYEEALISEKELLAVTLRSIGDGVITTNMRGNVTTMNPVAEALTGWSEKEARGKPVTEIFVIAEEASGEPCPNPVENVIRSGQIQSLCENTILTAKDNTEYLIADSGAPITDKNNEMLGVVLVFRDITEKHRLIEAAQNAEKLESLGLLAGGIAHDFNNLLGGIFGYIELGKLKNTDPNVTDLLDRALDTIEKARSLTRQLLTFAKGGDPVKKEQPLNVFVQETVTFLLSGTNVSWRFDFPEDIRPGYFDENQIRQVIENIVLNACHAMPDGGILEVSAENTAIRNEGPACADKNYIKLSIKDNGVGMPRDILPHIFDPYYTTRAKAHGLGLTTCFSIIKRHGGFMDVASEPGHGSAFQIYLPAADIPETATGEQANADFRADNRILVMDDEEVVREIMAEMIGALGFIAICTKNGEEALAFFLEEIRAGRPLAGMILDLTVPVGKGGIEIIDEIRRHDPGIPVFVVSGYSGDPVLARPEEYGFTASLKKPFQMREFKEILERHTPG